MDAKGLLTVNESSDALEGLLSGRLQPDQVEMRVKDCIACGAGPFDSVSAWANHICLPLELQYVAPGTDFLAPLHGKHRWACRIPEPSTKVPAT